MKARFTALSINSIDMKMEMMLRLIRKAQTPIENRAALRIRYQTAGTLTSLLLSREHDCTQNGHQNQDGRDLKRQQQIAKQDAAQVLRCGQKAAQFYVAEARPQG